MAFHIPYDARLGECGCKHLALYRALRDSILEGNLAAGEKLPSTRQLAKEYGLSRGSVSAAYEMLAAEGYVRSGVGQGTFVAGPDIGAEGPVRAGRPAAPETGGDGPALSAWGRRLMEPGPGDPAEAAPLWSEGDTGAAEADRISFKPVGIGPDWFPRAEWNRAVAREWKRPSMLRTPEAPAVDGSAELRRAIAARLRRERGIRCEADDVVVTGGSMQAIALLAQLLLDPGQSAVAENPGYPGIARAVRAAGARLLPEQVDACGIVPRDWDARLLLVTPTRQFPTGAVLTYDRRLALLDWARRRGAWIVEDDYDSDFRWGGRPIEPLKSLDREGRVVYVGSFSRTMRPEVRIGYAVVPPALREPLVRAKRLYDPYPAGIAEQRALAAWMASGGYDRHLRRARRTFGRLQALLREGLSAAAGPWLKLFPADAGLHLYARWQGPADAYFRFAEQSRKLGVSWGEGRRYEMDAGNAAPSALFGFAHLSEERIAEGTARIRRAAELAGLFALQECKGGCRDA